MLTFAVHAPGLPGLADGAHFHNEEWFRRSAEGRLRIRYNYNYFDLTHARCVEPNECGARAHYDAYEVDVRAAHDEFEMLYAIGTPIGCAVFASID